MNTLRVPEIQIKLIQLRATIKEVASTAIERISYRMPYYNYKGQLAWFALMQSTNSNQDPLFDFTNEQKL